MNAIDLNKEIAENTTANGVTDWAKLQAGEDREYPRFERIGQPGYGAIRVRAGVWTTCAWNGARGKSQPLPSLEAAKSVVAKIKSNTAFKVLSGRSGNI